MPENPMRNVRGRRFDGGAVISLLQLLSRRQMKTEAERVNDFIAPKYKSAIRNSSQTRGKNYAGMPVL
jgi:hypothetical protein